MFLDGILCEIFSKINEDEVLGGRARSCLAHLIVPSRQKKGVVSGFLLFPPCCSRFQPGKVSQGSGLDFPSGMYLNSPRFHNHKMSLYHDGRMETLPTPRGHAGVHFSDVPAHVIPATRQSFDEFRGYNSAAISRPVATVGALSIGGLPPHQLHHTYAAAAPHDGARHLVQGRLQSMGLDLHNPVTPRGPRGLLPPASLTCTLPSSSRHLTSCDRLPLFVIPHLSTSVFVSPNCPKQ